MVEITVHNMAHGKTYIKKHEFKTAEEEFLKVVEKNPKSTEAWYLIAQCRRHLYRLEEAFTAAQKAIEYEPNNPEALYELCEVYRQMGEHNKALEIAMKMDTLPAAQKLFDTKKLIEVIKKNL